MRFLFAHQNFPAQFRHVAAALAARGHDVVALGVHRREPIPGVRHVLYREPRHKPGVPQDPDAKARPWLAPAVDELNDKWGRGDAAARAMEVLRKSGFVPDVVVVHSGWGEATFVKDVFPAARMVVYAEYYYGGDGGDFGFDPEFSKPTLGGRHRVLVKNTHLLHALSACDAALTPTEFQKSRHPAWAHSKMHVIHEGIDTQRFRPDENARVHLRGAKLSLRPGDEVVTFTVRHLEPYRGYHVFMRALPLLQKLRPNARVVLAGGNGCSYSAPPPPGENWRDIFLKEVQPKLDMSRVHFVGTLPHDVLTQLMQVSALHVYLTYPFVLSWSLMEAMSVGCLILGSDTAPVREVIRHGENGLLTDFFDAERLAHAAADALARRGDLAPLRQAARHTIVTGYDLQNHCLPSQIALLEQTV
jgi:glycosyltransferase involved in cell wall biosynthesis